MVNSIENQTEVKRPDCGATHFTKRERLNVMKNVYLSEIIGKIVHKVQNFDQKDEIFAIIFEIIRIIANSI